MTCHHHRCICIPSFLLAFKVPHVFLLTYWLLFFQFPSLTSVLIPDWIWVTHGLFLDPVNFCFPSSGDLVAKCHHYSNGNQIYISNSFSRRLYPTIYLSLLKYVRHLKHINPKLSSCLIFLISIKIPSDIHLLNLESQELCLILLFIFWTNIELSTY